MCTIVYPSPISGHLDCFYFLAIVKNAAMNICIQVFVQPDGFISRDAIAGSHGKFILSFLGKYQTAFEQLNHFTSPHAMH